MLFLTIINMEPAGMIGLSPGSLDKMEKHVFALLSNTSMVRAWKDSGTFLKMAGMAA